MSIEVLGNYWAHCNLSLDLQCMRLAEMKISGHPLVDVPFSSPRSPARFARQLAGQ